MIYAHKNNNYNNINIFLWWYLDSCHWEILWYLNRTKIYLIGDIIYVKWTNRPIIKLITIRAINSDQLSGTFCSASRVFQWQYTILYQFLIIKKHQAMNHNMFKYFLSFTYILICIKIKHPGYGNTVLFIHNTKILLIMFNLIW